MHATNAVQSNCSPTPSSCSSIVNIHSHARSDRIGHTAHPLRLTPSSPKTYLKQRLDQTHRR